MCARKMYPRQLDGANYAHNPWIHPPHSDALDLHRGQINPMVIDKPAKLWSGAGGGGRGGGGGRQGGEGGKRWQSWLTMVEEARLNPSCAFFPVFFCLRFPRFVFWGSSSSGSSDQLGPRWNRSGSWKMFVTRGSPDTLQTSVLVTVMEKQMRLTVTMEKMMVTVTPVERCLGGGTWWRRIVRLMAMIIRGINDDHH